MPANQKYTSLDEVRKQYLQAVIEKKGRISKEVQQSFIHATGQLLKEQALDLQTEIRHLNFAEQFRTVVPKIGARPGIQVEVYNFKIQISGETRQHEKRLADLGFVGIVLGDTFGHISEEVNSERQHILQMQTLRMTYRLI